MTLPDRRPVRTTAPAGVEHLTDTEALGRLPPGGIAALTRAATESTFYREDLTPEQLADNRRIVEISEAIARAAARSDSQRLVVAFDGEGAGGFVIATRHGRDDHELDWLMVHPRLHGTPVSGTLMSAGMEWLGANRPMWLNVIRFNERAIRFYRRFGFEIDEAAEIRRTIPHWIMRRPAGGPDPVRA